MKLQEGPIFGAILIGTGVGYLVFRKTAYPAFAVAAGVGLAVADYFVLIWIQSFKKK